MFRDKAGAELAANAHRFVSRLAADRFLGYLRGQRAAMVGAAGAHTNRPELVARHGYDTKYATTWMTGCTAATRNSGPVPRGNSFKPRRCWVCRVSPALG